MKNHTRIRQHIAPLIFAALAAMTNITAAATPTVQARFHVDPEKGNDTTSGEAPDKAFRSLERARDAARAIQGEWSGDVEIVLHGRLYAMTKPLELGTQDSGRNGHRLRLVAAPDSKPVLDGGIRITGWKPDEKHPGLWSAPVPAGLATRQLFINGRRALRARSISSVEGIERTDTGYTLPADSAVGDWKNPSDLELVYRAIWTSPRVAVAGIEKKDDKVVVTMRQPGFINARNKGMTSIDKPWFFENAFELLDEPGEWYLDRTGAAGGMPAIYYKPHDWESVATSEFVVPVLEKLIVLRGDSIEAPVQNIDISGLGFAFTTWLRPGGDHGVPDAQNNVMRENFGPDLKRFETTRESVPEAAAIVGRYAREIAVENSNFSKLGGMGIFFGTGAQDIRITGNSFYDIAGTGIQLGDYVDWRFPGSEDSIRPNDPRLLIARNRIENNYLERCGVEYRSATGIAISIPRESVISNNEIINMPYSGMHFGWGWIVLDTSAMGDNRIENNFIRNTMVEVVDGGSIYFLGPTDPEIPPTVLRGNHALRTRWGQGFYFDEGSARYRAEDNLFERIGDANIKINGKSSTDIEVTGLYSEKSRNIVSKDLDPVRNRLSIEDPRPPGKEPHSAAARAIQENAGLAHGYKSIRPVRPDTVIHELDEGEVIGRAFVTTGMDVRPFVVGYSGMAYIDGLASQPGSGAELNANVSRAGEYELRLRYAAEKETPGLAWEIDGQPVTIPPLPATGDRCAWNVVNVRARLKAGDNTVVLTAKEKAPGFFLADRVDIVPADKPVSP